jgi:hypothetical protein
MSLLRNPLEMIGLSPAILDLGLTQDELYEHCKKVAQVLFARIHPDTHDGVITPSVLQVSEAFDLLKDRAEFNQALSAFRKERMLGRSTAVLHHRIQYLEAENRRLKRRLSVERRPYAF